MQRAVMFGVGLTAVVTLVWLGNKDVATLILIFTFLLA